MQMNSEKLLIVGCGDIGERLAQELQSLHYTVTGLRRSPPTLASPNLDYRHCDVGNHAAFASILSEGYSVIVVTMTPSERSDDGYQRAYVDTCRTLVDTLGAQQQLPRLLLFVSSTGVYGQDDGSLVDESSPTQPNGFSGQRLLEAEQIIRTSGFAHCIVRFSGIYGPGRNRLIQQVREGRASLSQAFTNRIHADDCAGVLAHLIERHREGQILEPVYIGSDCEPALMYEVMEWLAEQMAVPLVSTPSLNSETTATKAPITQGTAELSTVNKLIGANKRCGNQRLLTSGYRFRYPDYRAGYRALLAESSEPRAF